MGVVKIIPATAEQHQTLLSRGSKSRNKVSVGEPAEGSMRTRGAWSGDWGPLMSNACVVWLINQEIMTKLLTMDLWALATMKNAVKCEIKCDLHEL